MTTSAALQDLEQLKELYTTGFQDGFIDSALEKLVERQVSRDENDLAQLNVQLAEFEQTYGLTSDEFCRRYQDGQMDDTADFMEWNVLCKMRQRVEARPRERKSAMSVEEVLKTVQFVVDQEGKPTAAMLDIHTWEVLLALLEDLEDRGIVRERLTGWRSKTGWTRWGDFEAEADKDALPVVG